MRTPNGFDRISTQEELQQVRAVLNEFALSAWDSLEEVTAALVETPIEDEDAESLAEFVINSQELRN